jgi:hypothetical protein
MCTDIATAKVENFRFVVFPISTSKPDYITKPLSLAQRLFGQSSECAATHRRNTSASSLVAGPMLLGLPKIKNKVARNI